VVVVRQSHSAPGAGGGCSAAVIEFERVSKRYTSLTGRTVDAVTDLTLAVQAGEVLGIAGPNGAGKSTLINLLLGYLNPTGGRVRVEGLSPRQYVELHGVGYLPELLNIPPAWGAEGALRRYGTLAGVSARELPARVDEVIALLGLEEHRGKRVKALSKGNLQRLGLAQALLRHEVRVLVLDEPTHGLDPVWTQKFRTLVDDVRRPDRAVLIASHNLDELERVADRVAIIDRGRLQRVVDVRRHPAGGSQYRLWVAEGEDIVERYFRNVQRTGRGELLAVVEDVDVLNEGVAAAIREGARFTAITPAQSSLERHFREVVGET
jgi:ABC-2 type transport system ATP-binding protein